MGLTGRIPILLTLACLSSPLCAGPPEGFDGVVATPSWTVLQMPARGRRGVMPFPPGSKLKSIDELRISGPKPGHPHLLDQFAVDGSWGLVDGFVQPLNVKNAALRIGWADQFELEGTMEMVQYGGWFLIVGWDQGRGYLINNINLKKSGSPWFVGEIRGAKTLEERTIELPSKFEWKGRQGFKLSVVTRKLSLSVGGENVIEQLPLEDYSAGEIILGVYDAEYGPRPLRLQSLRLRAVNDTGTLNQGDANP